MGFVNYRNGNYVVYFNTETGDKIRNTNAASFKPAFAENCDVTISEYCDGACPFCYAGCSLQGRHGNLNAKFLETLHPYTELAINGNDLSHPDLVDFLTRMRNRGIIVNMTVNQKHFERHFDKIISLQKRSLLYGVGVSFVHRSETFLSKVKSCHNVVVHVIESIISKEDIEFLAGHNLNILILGYKTTGRGGEYLDAHSEECAVNAAWLRSNLFDLFNQFNSISFDNLALERLNIQNLVSKDVWSRHYMGDDGDFTFFINLVDGYFAKNSTSPKHYPLMDSADEMFAVIQKEKEI